MKIYILILYNYLFYLLNHGCKMRFAKSLMRSLIKDGARSGGTGGRKGTKRRRTQQSRPRMTWSKLSRRRLVRQ